jgi:3D-(3,5/4)-trihydroxycyclohexane-1,2-dione acylhydrolase (decyclizing)
MGYEIAGALGVKMAAPDHEVYVMQGDGGYLMLNSEIVTSLQEGYKLIVVLFDNFGYKSIGSLSRSLGQKGFATRYVYPKDNVLPGDEDGESVEMMPVDLAENARSLGAHVIKCTTYDDFAAAIKEAELMDRTTMIYIQNDRYVGVPGYESWWDVHVAEVSEMESVREARREWEVMRTKERYFL